MDTIVKINKKLENLGYKIACVIPAYNEAPRIESVLDVVLKYPYFSEVIVVDDGSTDDTYNIVKKLTKRFRHLKVLKNRKNLGKAKTVIKGVKNANADIIVLIDADLKTLKNYHISKLIYPLINDGYDMTILDRISDRLSIVGITGLGRLFGGERAFWKKDFEKIDFSKTEYNGYNLETVMNVWYLKNDKRVRTIFAPDLVSSYQFEKWGKLIGLKRYINMFWNVYKATGLRNFYIQLSEIEDDNLSELYEFYNKVKRTKVKHMVRPILFFSVILAGVSIFSVYSLKRLKTLDILSKNKYKKSR